MRERAAFLAGYLKAAEAKNRTLARELASRDPEGKDTETWRKQIRRYLAYENEPGDEATKLLAEALGVDPRAFPPVHPKDTARRLESLEESIVNASASVTRSVDALSARVRRIEDQLGLAERQGPNEAGGS